MRAGFGRRFGFEVAFIVLVAVVAALRHASTLAIVLVMAAAWLAVSLLEWLLSRRAATAERSLVLSQEPEPTPLEVAPHVRVIEQGAEPVASANAAEREESVGREPWPEPEPEPVEAEAEAEQDAEPEPPEAEAEPEPEAEPELELEPEPEPEEEPEPAAPVAEPEPEEDPAVAEAALAEGPRSWNVWELERLAHAVAGDDLVKDEERAYLLVYLRDFASPDGLLPEDFDLLVRESFGDLLAAPFGG